MNVLSLCSGVGGLDRFTRSLGWRTLAYVERDEYRQAVLHARMRDGRLDSAPLWPDLRTFDGVEWRGAVDCIVGGFPCQPFSTAGKQRGADDPRNLWPEVNRILREVRPRFAFLENVPGLLHGAYWGTILGDLAEGGFDVRWDCVPASAAGAPHRRDRLWILVADASDGRRGTSKRNVHGGQFDITRSGTATLADARHELEHVQPPGTGAELADAESNGRGEGWPEPERGQGRPDATLGGSPVADSQDFGLERAGDSWNGRAGFENDGRWPARPGEPQYEWEAPRTVEPPVGRVANGTASRVDRLRALGDAVIPQQARLAWDLLTKSPP